MQAEGTSCKHATQAGFLCIPPQQGAPEAIEKYNGGASVRGGMHACLQIHAYRHI